MEFASRSFLFSYSLEITLVSFPSDCLECCSLPFSRIPSDKSDMLLLEGVCDEMDRLIDCSLLYGILNGSKVSCV